MFVYSTQKYNYNDNVLQNKSKQLYEDIYHDLNINMIKFILVQIFMNYLNYLIKSIIV
jgi:hypothetical protein